MAQVKEELGNELQLVCYFKGFFFFLNSQTSLLLWQKLAYVFVLFCFFSIHLA